MKWLVSHRYLCSALVGGPVFLYAMTGARWAIVVALMALWLRLILADPV